MSASGLYHAGGYQGGVSRRLKCYPARIVAPFAMLLSPTYGESHRECAESPAVVEARRAIWEAAGYPWSLRLKALRPLWLPWARRRLPLPPAVERQRLAISPRQMDRRLAPYRRQLTKRL